MPVISPFVLVVGSVSYDLRKVVSWWDSNPQTSPATVNVRFQDTPNTSVLFTKSTFESAMQNAQDAS